MEPTQGELESLAHVDDGHKTQLKAKDGEKGNNIKSVGLSPTLISAGCSTDSTMA